MIVSARTSGRSRTWVCPSCFRSSCKTRAQPWCYRAVPIDPGSPADDQAGIKPGDRILAEAGLGRLSTAEDAKRLAAVRDPAVQVRIGRRVAWLRFR